MNGNLRHKTRLSTTRCTRMTTMRKRSGKDTTEVLLPKHCSIIYYSNRQHSVDWPRGMQGEAGISITSDSFIPLRNSTKTTKASHPTGTAASGYLSLPSTHPNVGSTRLQPPCRGKAPLHPLYAPEQEKHSAIARDRLRPQPNGVHFLTDRARQPWKRASQTAVRRLNLHDLIPRESIKALTFSPRLLLYVHPRKKKLALRGWKRPQIWEEASEGWKGVSTTLATPR